MESVEIIWELAVVGFIAGRLLWSKDAVRSLSVEASVANPLDGKPREERRVPVSVAQTIPIVTPPVAGSWNQPHTSVVKPAADSPRRPAMLSLKPLQGWDLSCNFIPSMQTIWRVFEPKTP